MSEEQVRVACPACGRRFKMPPSAVPEGDEGKAARCRGCEAAFVVKREGASLRAVASGGAPDTPVAQAKPAKRRRQARDSDAEPRPARKRSAPRPLPVIDTGPFGVGDRVGRYEIESVLARGGMGGIYTGYDPSANRHVALKVLVSTATELDKVRFQREIQVQGNIQHPQIMPIFDSGMIGAVRYYTMELLKDPLDLVELTEQLGDGRAAKDPKLRPISTLEGLVRKVVLPVCRATHHANVNEGVLHRDLKPGNILIDRNGLRVFVIDFGVSSILEKTNARLAHLDRDLPVPLSGRGVSITGTLVFMPPEQARGQADKRGDVWALGAVLHYLVSGQPPLAAAVRPNVPDKDRIQGLQFLAEEARAQGNFSEAANYEDTIRSIREGTERTLDDLRRDVLAGHYQPRPAGVPAALEAIIDKAMRPDPEQRYRHAMDLHDDLEAWLEGRPVRAQLRRAGALSGTLYRVVLFAKRHKALVAVILLAIGGMVAVAKLWPETKRVDLKRLAHERFAEAEAAEKAGDRSTARTKAHETLRLDPERAEVFELLARVAAAERLDLAVARAKQLHTEAEDAFRAGDLVRGGARRAALDEVLTTQILPVLHAAAAERHAQAMLALVPFARGEQALRVIGAPPGCAYELLPVAPGPGPVGFQGGTDLPSGPEGLATDAVVRPGSWVLRVRRGAGELFLPFIARDGGTEVELTCPLDPQTLGGRTLYVGAGSVAGPLGTDAVPALLWDRAEVTGAEYAAFLATLTPEERRERVPRVAGSLGAPGEPLWDRDGEGFKPPLSASSRAVEGISVYDARAYAAWAQKRLPTAAEWAWAASGPDGRACAAGTLRDLTRGGVHVDRPLAGVADGRTSPIDRSPFGLYDMAGNVAELTSTLGVLRGESGWFVMGGSYLTSPSAAFVGDARLVPGWMPLQGVGFRCVRPAP